MGSRNRLEGTIVEAGKCATTAHVRLDVNGTIVVTSIINTAVDDLGLPVGQEGYGIAKASGTMVGTT